MRPRTLKQILEKRYKIIELGGIIKDMFGQVEQNGLWLIWGDEKTGKSTFSIVLAGHFATTRKKHKKIELGVIIKDIFEQVEKNGLWRIWVDEKMSKSTFSIVLADHFANTGKKVLYVMAEQGFDLDFQQLLKRVKIRDKRKLKFMEYVPLEDLDESLKKPRSAEIVFIDNVTIYADEMDRQTIQALPRRHRNKIFVFIAHAQDGKPYTAAAKLISKISKRIVKVE